MSSALATALLVSFYPSLSVEADRLRAHVGWLTNPELAGRRSGQPGAMRSAAYIQEQLRQLGYNVQLQDFGNNRRNVIARSGNAARHIIVGAHYDGQSARPSASDNAAGVGLLLEIARELRGVTLPVSLVLIAFDDEEQGLNGSRFYTENPAIPLQETMAVLVFDTMGRSFVDLKQTPLFALGTEYSAELAAVVTRSSGPGTVVAGTDLVGARSDFAPFAVKRIPYLFFTHGTHKDYHQSGDRPELLNYAKLAQDGDWIRRLIVDIAALKTKPTYRNEPVYPPGEKDAVLAILSAIEAERKDAPKGYTLVMSDMRQRIGKDFSRETLRVASAAMLALASPELSEFLLEAIVVPFYEKQNRPDIARALAETVRRVP